MVASFPFAVVLQGVDRLTGPLGRIQGKFASVGASAQALGKRLTLSVTAPVAGIFGLAIKEGIESQVAWNRFGASAGLVGDELARVRKEAEAMSGGLFADEEQAAGLQALVQRGFDAQKSLSALVPAQHLARAGNITLAESMVAMGDALNAFGLGIEHAGDVSDALAVGSVRGGVGVMEMAEALQAASKIAPEFGANLSGLASQIVGLKRLGLGGGETITKALGSLIDLKGNQKGLDALAGLGLDPGDLRKSTGELLDLFDVVELMRSRGAGAEEFGAVFGKRLGPTLARQAREGTEAMRKFRGEMEETGAAMRLADQSASPTADALKRLKISGENLLQTIGEGGLLDKFTKLVDKLTSVVKWVDTLDPGLLGLVVTVAAAGAALGPPLLGFGLLVRALQQIYAWSTKATAGLTSVAAAATAAGTASAAAGGASAAGGAATAAGAGGLLTKLGRVGSVLGAAYVTYEALSYAYNELSKTDSERRLEMGIKDPERQTGSIIDLIEKTLIESSKPPAAERFAAGERGRAPAGQAEIRVVFENAPRGMRAKISKALAADVDLSVGHQMLPA